MVIYIPNDLAQILLNLLKRRVPRKEEKARKILAGIVEREMQTAPYQMYLREKGEK